MTVVLLWVDTKSYTPLMSAGTGVDPVDPPGVVEPPEPEPGFVVPGAFRLKDRSFKQDTNTTEKRTTRMLLAIIFMREDLGYGLPAFRLWKRSAQGD